MNNKEYYDQCEKCGRPFPKAKPCACSCNFGLGEYRQKVKGCIRNKNPECPYNCVIASVTVETVDGIKNLADCFAHVTNINTTFYIDDKHRIMTVWAGPVEMEYPDIPAEEMAQYIIDNELGLRSQFLYLKGMSQDTPAVPFVDAIYYDKTGKPFFAGEFEEVTEE